MTTQQIKEKAQEIDKECLKNKKTEEINIVNRADGMDYAKLPDFTVDLKEEDRVKIASPFKGFGGV